MENNAGKQKGIPFNKWKDEENVQKKKTLLKKIFDEMISDPSNNEKTKKWAKNIKRVGLK